MRYKEQANLFFDANALFRGWRSCKHIPPVDIDLFVVWDGCRYWLSEYDKFQNSWHVLDTHLEIIEALLWTPIFKVVLGATNNINLHMEEYHGTV